MNKHKYLAFFTAAIFYIASVIGTIFIQQTWPMVTVAGLLFIYITIEVTND
jgi:uncharacterized membrane protein YccC